MKKIIIVILVLFFAATGQAQKKDSLPVVAQPTQAEVNKFLDSLDTKTSVKEFKAFLYETASAKFYNEGKFAELYDLYIQQKYDAWIIQRGKTKTKQ